MYQSVIANLSNKVRFVTKDGRKYVVAPVVMLRSQVLSGSQGALYYPEAEIARNYKDWHGVPLTHGHPIDRRTNAHLSASSPGVWESQGLGYLLNPKLGKRGKLSGQAWFDIERAKRINPTLLRKVMAGQPVSISTGLYTDNIEAPAGSHYQGTPYLATATNHRPDHLAILDGQNGACDIVHGCGINLNLSYTPYGRRIAMKHQLHGLRQCSCATNNQHLDPDPPLGMPQCVSGILSDKQRKQGLVEESHHLPVYDLRRLREDSLIQPAEATRNDMSEALAHSSRARQYARGSVDEVLSEIAHEDTMRAMRNPSRLNHLDASASHALAASEHSDSGNSEAAEAHTDAANEHTKLSRGYHDILFDPNADPHPRPSHYRESPHDSAYPGEFADLDQQPESTGAGLHDVIRDVTDWYYGSGDKAGYDTTIRTTRNQRDAIVMPGVSLQDLIAVNNPSPLSHEFKGTGYEDESEQLQYHEDEALRAAGKGDHAEAARHHEKAAEYHHQLGNHARSQGKHRLSQHHREAADRHLRAAGRHEGMPSFESVTGNSYVDYAMLLRPQVLVSNGDPLQGRELRDADYEAVINEALLPIPALDMSRRAEQVKW